MLNLLIYIVVTLLVVGVLLWAINAMPAIDPTMKQIARIVIIVAAVFWVIYLVFPGASHLNVIRVGRP